MSTVTLDNKTILVTGAAGFIGSNLVKRIYQEAPSATVCGRQPCSTGWCALLHHQPGCLCGIQLGRFL